jgi:hypothetical protein
VRPLCLCAAVLAFSFAEPLLACRCQTPASAKKAMAVSAAVFTGKVIAVEKLNAYTTRATIEVTRAYKGTVEKKVWVYTASTGDACGFTFEKDASYLVYAKEKGGEEKVFSTHLCSRSCQLADAKEDLVDLQELADK